MEGPLIAECVLAESCGAVGAAPYGSCALDSGARGFCCGAECLDSNTRASCGICGVSCGSGACDLGVCNAGVTSCGYGLECDAGYGCSGAECLPLTCSGAPDTSACWLDAGVIFPGPSFLPSPVGYRGTCQAGVCEGPCGAAGCTPPPPVDCAANANDQLDYDTCLTDGGTPGACCGTACVDLTTGANCSSCDLVCPADTTCGVNEGQDECLFDAGCTNESCPAGDACVAVIDPFYYPPLVVSVGCVPTTCDGSNASCSLDGGWGRCCGTACNPGPLFCGASCPSGSVPTTLPTTGCVAPNGDPVSCSEGATCPVGTICSSVWRQCIPLDFCAAWGSSGGTGCPFGVLSDGYYGSCCGPLCVDWTQDPSNCGGCGTVCPSGVCMNAQCLPLTATDDCGGSCPQGSICLDGLCIDGSCENASFCLAENGTVGTCCGDGSCAHPLDDPQNCGLCGNACGPGGTCVNGSCTNFPGCGLGRGEAYCDVDAGPGFVCCPSSGCTDTGTDAQNCGACGTSCPASFICLGGNCTAAG